MTACATGPSLDSDSWRDHRAVISRLKAWDVEGKVALRSPGDAAHARLAWQQRGDDSDLQLRGPFGAGAAAIARRGRQLAIAADGEVTTLDDLAAAAVEARTGWPVPVDALAWWLRGLPAPGAPARALELDAGRVRAFRQLGWRLRYDSYQPALGTTLPRRFSLELPERELSVTVVVLSWSVPDEARSQP